MSGAKTAGGASRDVEQRSVSKKFALKNLGPLMTNGLRDIAIAVAALQRRGAIQQRTGASTTRAL